MLLAGCSGHGSAPSSSASTSSSSASAAARQAVVRAVCCESAAQVAQALALVAATEQAYPGIAKAVKTQLVSEVGAAGTARQLDT